MLYAAVGDLGKQKGTQSPLPTASIFFFFSPTATYSTTLKQGEEGTFSSHLLWQVKRNQLAGSARLIACQLDYSDTGYSPTALLEDIARWGHEIPQFPFYVCFSLKIVRNFRKNFFFSNGKMLICRNKVLQELTLSNVSQWKPDTED